MKRSCLLLSSWSWFLSPWPLPGVRHPSAQPRHQPAPPTPQHPRLASHTPSGDLSCATLSLPKAEPPPRLPLWLHPPLISSAANVLRRNEPTFSLFSCTQMQFCSWKRDPSQYGFSSVSLAVKTSDSSSLASLMGLGLRGAGSLPGRAWTSPGGPCWL